MAPRKNKALEVYIAVTRNKVPVTRNKTPIKTQAKKTIGSASKVSTLPSRKRQENKKSANKRIENYSDEDEEDREDREDGEDEIGEYEQCLDELEEDNIGSASKASALPLRRQNSPKSMNVQDQKIRNKVTKIYSDDDEHRLENNYEEFAKNSASKVSRANTYTSRTVTMDSHATTGNSMAMPMCRNKVSHMTAVTSAAIPTNMNKDTETQITKFFDASNEFEIALWIANHPKILNLAMIIQRAQVTNIDDSYKTLLDNDNMSNNLPSNISISEIDHILKTDVRMKTLIRDVGTWYDGYQYNFHRYILGLANQYSQLHEGEELVDSELSEFVGVNVWCQILQLHLKCTDMVEMAKHPEIFTKLGIFVCQALKAVLIAGNNYQSTSAAIRDCDEYTIDLKIPTRLGVVKSLPVRELLNL
ncbi:5487_t:CDS:2 [Dentiscutata heterogama]|uniref:5487_t:CDS:1 n=1 Tax=Dentiscutata heterogama TaxID=1316150 RepID=A0ACA9KED5_9GLOM|nr:5487_t:CDS:2 [Dentiscutata heterogama]